MDQMDSSVLATDEEQFFAPDASDRVGINGEIQHYYRKQQNNESTGARHYHNGQLTKHGV